MKVGSLCAGYDGIEMGLRLAGEDVNLRWLAEFDPALDVLHPAGVPNLGDITTLDWAAVEPVDLLTAGFPCQPFSAAGSQLAESDPRYLWPAVRTGIEALRPPRVLLENVRNLISMRKGEVFARILSDLTNLGYDVTWLTLGACAVGAAHHRHRVFVLATHTQWSEPRVTRLDIQECGARRGSIMIPTPAARDDRDRGGAGQGERKSPNLPTTMVGLSLLPTPRATVDPVGGPGQRGSSGDLAMPSAVQPEHWGRFADAVTRHASVFGPPPAPTEPNRNGAPRLAPAFAEWLMCIPAGHVTDALPRGAALKAIGNGVCPPQLAQAWRYLTAPMRPLDVSLGQPLASHLVTTDTIQEIQGRNAEHRARVIEATMALGVTVDPALIQAAMMELAAVWREEAAWFTAQKRKGHVTTSKELTQAAARLAGFAVGLTSRPVATPDYAEVGARAAGYESLAAAKKELEPLDHESQCECGHPNCAALSLSLPAPDLRAAATCVHPDNARSTLKSGNILCTLCNTVVGQVEQLAEIVPGTRPGPVVTGDPTMDYLTGAVSTYEPRTAPPATTLVVPWLPDLRTGPNGEIAWEPSSTVNGEAAVQPTPITPAVDNPFTSPASPGVNRAPVKRLTYGELGPLIAATYPGPRPHLSHSYVESLGNCGLSALLSDAAKSQHIGPRRPSWSLLGGTAFHNAVEAIERVAISIGGADPAASMSADWEAFWLEALTLVVDETTKELAGTPYANASTWHVANKGLEGYDWWRVQGLDMVKRYLAFHDTDWRSQHTLLQVPAEPANPQSARVPVLEFPFSVSAGSTAITTEGRIDIAWLSTAPEHRTAALEVVDFKAGKSTPSEHFQLVEYGDVLRKHLPVNFALPIVGRYWLARKGEYTAPIPLPAEPGRDEIDYRYRVADRAMRNAVFTPHPNMLCTSCGVLDYCPAQSLRDQTPAV